MNKKDIFMELLDLETILLEQKNWLKVLISYCAYNSYESEELSAAEMIAKSVECKNIKSHELLEKIMDNLCDP